MDIKQIQELVKLVNKSNIGELSIEQENFKITIKQKKEASQYFNAPAVSSSRFPSTCIFTRRKKGAGCIGSLHNYKEPHDWYILPPGWPQQTNFRKCG